MGREETDTLDTYRSKRADEISVNSRPVREDRNKRSTTFTIHGNISHGEETRDSSFTR